jgi:hypothetical protein
MPGCYVAVCHSLGRQADLLVNHFASSGIHILREICLNTETGVQVADAPNLNADVAIFFLRD